MGYTTNNTTRVCRTGEYLLSAISIPGYRQNVKTIEEYYEMLEQGSFPIVKGRSDTTRFGTNILDITCNLETMMTEQDFANGYRVFLKC